MDEIKNAISHQLKYNNSLQAYTYFCNELEKAFKNCCVLTKDVDSNTTPVQNETEYALKAVTISIANLVYAQKVIALQTPKEIVQTEEEKREQKEQEKQLKKEIKEEKKKDKKVKKQSE